MSALTGQKGKIGSELGAESAVQRRGSVYALMQKQLTMSPPGRIVPAAISASAAGGAQMGRKFSILTGSGGEAARGKDVDSFGLKKNGVGHCSSSSEEDEDDDDDDDDDDCDDDDDDDDDDGPERLWRYASFALQGEPLSAAASEHVKLPKPEGHGEFVTLALPHCLKPLGVETASGQLEQLTRMKV